MKTGVNVKQIFKLHTAEHDPSITWTLGNASHGRLPGQVILADGTVELDTQHSSIPNDCLPQVTPGCGVCVCKP